MFVDGTEERFWSNVDTGSEEDCWEWLASTKGRGYGQFWVTYEDGSKENWYAHRLAYKLEYGEIDKPQVNHNCDNMICVNPNHLYNGTQSDNRKDAYRRGRASEKGENAGSSKLTEEEVIEIRDKVDNSTYRELADEYGVTMSCINHIVNRRSWKHI